MTRTGGYSRRGIGIKNMREIFLGFILLFALAGLAMCDGSRNNCQACESNGQAGKSSSQGVSNGASTGSQNAGSSVGNSSGVAQSDNGDGTGPSDFSLIDCDNPLFESFLPCREVSREGNND